MCCGCSLLPHSFVSALFPAPSIAPALSLPLSLSSMFLSLPTSFYQAPYVYLSLSLFSLSIFLFLSPSFFLIFLSLQLSRPSLSFLYVSYSPSLCLSFSKLLPLFLSSLSLSVWIKLNIFSTVWKYRNMYPGLMEDVVNCREIWFIVGVLIP